MQKQITDAFGGQFWSTLTEWEPINPVALQLAMAIVEKSDIYGTELPTETLNAGARRRHAEADEYARVQMMRKLVELQKQHVLFATRSSRNAQGGEPDDRAQRLDLFLRYQTKSRRDFYHTLHEYWRLKETEKVNRQT
jgi:hypothetical protein